MWIFEYVFEYLSQNGEYFTKTLLHLPLEAHVLARRLLVELLAGTVDHLLPRR